MKKVGIILSDASTKEAFCQLYEEMERYVKEGMFLVIHTRERNSELKILARVDELRSYNDFYRIGDVWSEARRKGKPLPSSIARKYVICRLELLGTIPDLGDVKIPPVPGDFVYLLDDPKDIFEKSRQSDIIYLEFGTLFGYKNAPVPLSIEAFPMHLAVIGVTGSGKSYTVGYLLELLGNIGFNERRYGFPAIVIDANGDYLELYHQKEGFEHHYSDIWRIAFPGSTAYQSGDANKPIKIDLDFLHPRELAELIMDFYKGLGDGSELAISFMESFFDEFKDTRESINVFFTDKNLFKTLKNEINKHAENLKLHSATKGAVIRAIEHFREEVVKADIIKNNFDVEDVIDEKIINTIVDERILSIIDFSTDGATGISIKMKQLIVAYLSILLYNRFVEYKIESKGKAAKYILFIIEEAQYYCPNLKIYPVGSNVARKYLSLIATQGRKFGIGLILVTQRPSFIDPIVMSMMNSFIVHRISPDDVSFLRRLIGGLPTVFQNRLTNLKTGTAIITGQILPIRFPVLVEVGKRKITPRMGSTNVSNFFR